MCQRRWILGLLLMLAPVLAAGQNLSLVKAEKSLSLRESPSSRGKVLDQLVRYQPVQVVDRKNKEWAKVKTTGGKTGWVLASYLTKTGFVHVSSDQVNVRSGPGTEYPIIMNYYRNFPLRVLDTAGNGWLKILDCDGDRGWIHASLVSHDPPYVITTAKSSNIRTGPGTDNPTAFVAVKGIPLEVLAEKDGWLNVKHTEGEKGWISEKIVFGWLDVADPSPKESKKDK